VLARTLAVASAAAVTAISGTATTGSAGAESPAAKDTQTRATVTARNTRYGRILFDGSGRALYAFTRDRRGGASRCYGACAKAWPVYFAKGRLLAGTTVKQSLIGTTRRRDGRLQVTYDGRPLYYFVKDRPGEVKCQGVAEFGGTWLVVRPSGQVVR
jgi:predicted lipoprotein with Yx(FWY)xxD motif